jgi:hypothetical protein
VVDAETGRRGVTEHREGDGPAGVVQAVQAVGSGRPAGGLADGSTSHCRLRPHQPQGAGGQQADAASAVRRGDRKPSRPGRATHRFGAVAAMIGI